MVELGKHAEKVMAALDEGIRGLDNMDDFLTCLHQVGATHTKIPDFNPQYFWVSSQKVTRYILDIIGTKKSYRRSLSRYCFTNV